MRRVASLIAIALLLPSLHVAAQERGQRIRLETVSAPAKWLAGTLISADGDSVRLHVAGFAQPVAVAQGAVTRLETSRGQRRAVLEGAGIGMGIGFGVGLIEGVARSIGNSGSCGTSGFLGLCYLDREARVLQGSLIGGAIGGIVGAAFGYAARTERWEGVPLSRAHHLALAPRGAGLALSLTF